MPEPGTPVPLTRRVYIDWARGVAVLLMIEAHTTDAWTRASAKSTRMFHDVTILSGFAAPLLWCFLIYGSLSAINPVMNQRIHWLWFVLSQIGFGLVAGLVVARQERIGTRQPAPLAVRMGIEAPGLIEENHEDSDHGDAKQ